MQDQIEKKSKCLQNLYSYYCCTTIVERVTDAGFM